MLDLLKAAFGEFKDDDAPQLAAALAYYTVFSLPPLLILLVLVAGVIWDPQDVQGRIVEQIGGAAGSEGAQQIRSILAQADRPAGRGTLITILSVAALVFGATAAFGQLQKSLNQAWEVRKDPRETGLLSLVMTRVVSFGMILVIAFLLLVSLVLSAVIGSAGGAIASALPGPVGPGALWAVDLGLSLLVITVLFMAMYKVLPDADVSWGDVWHGALITAVLFVVGTGSTTPR